MENIFLRKGVGVGGGGRGWGWGKREGERVGEEVGESERVGKGVGEGGGRNHDTGTGSFYVYFLFLRVILLFLLRTFLSFPSPTYYFPCPFAFCFPEES